VIDVAHDGDHGRTDDLRLVLLLSRNRKHQIVFNIAGFNGLGLVAISSTISTAVS